MNKKVKMNFNMNLREAIVERVRDKDSNELLEVLESSIGGDERALPGLGVLFEIIWTHSEKESQQELVAILHDHLPSSQDGGH